MARYLISVGGTGQHIALACTRLAMMRAIDGDLRLIALDPDNETDLPRRLASPLEWLSGSKHPLQDGTVRAPFDMARLGKKNFAELFVDPDHPIEQELFECLFDADEASVPIHKGMYGMPCVGSTVFAEGANTQALENLLRPLSTAERVFVCGSVVGGTGAGLIHKLVGEIKRHYHGELYGIFMLPWFDVTASGGPNAITPALISRNASHGIKYFYEHTIPQLTASVLIGFPGTEVSAVLKKPLLGEGFMGESPSYLHLVAARAIVDLPNAHTSQRDIKAYGVIHAKGSDEGWLLDQTWEQGSTLRRLVRAMRVQHNLLGFLTHDHNRRKILDYFDTSFLTKIFNDKSSFAPLATSIENVCTEKKQRRAFTEQVLDRFGQIHRESAFCLEWVQKLFPPALLDNPNDALMARLADAARARAESPVHWEQLRSWWAGEEMDADPNRTTSAQEVAEHHAAVLLRKALNP